jgi:hypothetical protein
MEIEHHQIGRRGAARRERGVRRLRLERDPERLGGGRDAGGEEQVGHHDQDAARAGTRSDDAAGDRSWLVSATVSSAAAGSVARVSGSREAARWPRKPIAPHNANRVGAFIQSIMAPPSIGSTSVGPRNVFIRLTNDCRVSTGASSITRLA